MSGRSGNKRGGRRDSSKSNSLDDSAEGGSTTGGNGDSWECTLCTYRNRFEAFKCDMCETRKGTSTRKPRLNADVVERQQIVQNFVVQQQQLQAQGSPPSQTATTTNNNQQQGSGGTGSGKRGRQRGAARRSSESPAATTNGRDSRSHSPSDPDDADDDDYVEHSDQQMPVVQPEPPAPAPAPAPQPPRRIHRRARRSSAFQEVIDVNSARTLTITVNDVTVVVTDYKLRRGDEGGKFAEINNLELSRADSSNRQTPEERTRVKNDSGGSCS